MRPASRSTTIFSKQPTPGLVKTRLVPRLDPAAAAELALAMLDDTVAKCSRERAFETVLCVDPAPAVAWFRERYVDVPRVLAQVGDGLGARLAQHSSSELACAGRTLVVIGSDAPHVAVEACTEAHERLERGADLVLGLDDGGGYHLVALSRPCPELFTQVAMSSADMADHTLRLARTLGLAVEFVAPGFDVDEPADLVRLWQLVASGALAPARLSRTAEFLSRTC